MTHLLNTDWTESFVGGSAQREESLASEFAEQISLVQQRNRKDEGEPIRRAFHAKLLAGVANARVEVSPEIRRELRTGMLVPRASYPAIVRLSSASGMIRPDDEADLRGIAVRILLAGGEKQDVLLTNAPASHARDARQFMVTALAMAGGRRLGALPLMVRKLGPSEAVRILLALRRASSRPIQSLATETFWSRGPFAIGPYAVKLVLRPVTLAAAGEGRHGRDHLRNEFIGRLRKQDIRYRFEVQHYLDQRRTPIEDGTVDWTQENAPSETIAELILPRQDLATGNAGKREQEIDGLEFSPWNAAGGLRPVGGLNRARKLAYPASARLRARSL
jgi:hypothetical protein